MNKHFEVQLETWGSLRSVARWPNNPSAL